jgi:hypothetical protein
MSFQAVLVIFFFQTLDNLLAKPPIPLILTLLLILLVGKDSPLVKVLLVALFVIFDCNESIFDLVIFGLKYVVEEREVVELFNEVRPDTTPCTFLSIANPFTLTS